MSRILFLLIYLILLFVFWYLVRECSTFQKTDEKFIHQYYTMALTHSALERIKMRSDTIIID